VEVGCFGWLLPFELIFLLLKFFNHVETARGVTAYQA
jgi:hypothetical protein